VDALASQKSAAKNANPLPWSNNDHGVKTFYINEIRVIHPATELKPAVMPLIDGRRWGVCA
jgi:hypothetical protein